MNKPFQTTAQDLTRALQRSLLRQRMQEASQTKANQIVAANEHNHRGLQGKVVQTGPWSWMISFTAPGLWASTFGSPDQAETGFETGVGYSSQKGAP